MSWTVTLKRSAEKELNKIPRQAQVDVRNALVALVRAIESGGPVRGELPNYRKLQPPSADLHHCHLVKGRPTYVACWSVDRRTRTVEIYYVGTHEKAPY